MVSKKLENVSNDKYFRAANGTVIKSLMELERAFENMSDETCIYHANERKNDFSSWVRDVIDDNELANSLWNIKDRREAQVAVLRRIIEILSKNE